MSLLATRRTSRAPRSASTKSLGSKRLNAGIYTRYAWNDLSRCCLSMDASHSLFRLVVSQQPECVPIRTWLRRHSKHSTSRTSVEMHILRSCFRGSSTGSAFCLGRVRPRVHLSTQHNICVGTQRSVHFCFHACAMNHVNSSADTCGLRNWDHRLPESSCASFLPRRALRHTCGVQARAM